MEGDRSVDEGTAASKRGTKLKQWLCFTRSNDSLKSLDASARC